MKPIIFSIFFLFFFFFSSQPTNHVPAKAPTPIPEKAIQDPALLKQLENISKSLADIKQSKKIADAEIKKLKEEINDLNKNIVLLKNSEKIIEKATVAITNSWTSPINVLLNGKWVKVPSGLTKVVKISPGVLTWRVYEIPGHVLQERPMKTGEKYSIGVVSDAPAPATTQTPVYWSPPTPIYWNQQPVYYQQICNSRRCR